MSAWVRVENVLALANPIENWPWCARPAGLCGRNETLRDVVELAEPQAMPVEQWATSSFGEEAEAQAHLGRIRHLMSDGWSDAIEIDVGIPALNYAGPAWPVTDGNHRLAAAALRGDALILVQVTGQLDHAARMLGVSEASLIEKQCAVEG